MTSLTIPFNFNPESVSVKTGSFSIPVGKYAFISTEVRNGGSFSIGGTIAIQSTGYAIAAVNVVQLGNTSNVGITVPANSFFEGQISLRNGTGTGDFDIGGNTMQAVDMSLENIFRCKAGPSIDVEADKNGNSADAILTGYTRTIDGSESNTMNFWVPESTALTISGDARYTVSIFAIP